MNVYCIKDNTLMVQHEDVYICLKCEFKVRLEFLPKNWVLKSADQLCNDNGCKVPHFE